jgi:arsenate reductase (thioredoxin)
MSTEPKLCHPEPACGKQAKRRISTVLHQRLTMTHRVLILCTGNCVRSQMAEGLLRHLGGSAYEVHSAGSKPNGYVSELAIKAMDKIGIDISSHRSKSVSEFEGQRFDTVITVCDSAAQECPAFPGSQQMHWSIWDPGNASGSHEEKLAAFCRVRDDLASRLRQFLAAHSTEGKS